MTSAADSVTRTGLSRRARAWLLGLLAATYTCAFIDRIVVATIGPAIIADLKLTDFEFGLLGGAAFALFFSTFGVPVARLAERRNRATIIAAAIAIWSVMTMACGIAATYWQLLLCRVGVGFGEAGGTPPAHALISDHYPPQQRASALSIYSVGVPAGALVGAVASGWFAARFGWRMAFVLVGAPGLLLALLVKTTIGEPRLARARRSEPSTLAEEDAPGVADAVTRMAASRTLRHLIAACTLTTTAANGINLFAPAYFVRAFGLSLAQVGALYGSCMGVAGIVGIVAGGFVADLGARRDRRWFARVPALGVALACPLYLLAYGQTALTPAIALVFASGAIVSVYFAPTIALAHNLVGSRIRALTSALILLAMNVFGQGLGPAVMGAMSDRFAARAFLPGTYSVTCGAGAHAAGALAAACQAAAASGLRQSIAWTSVLFAWGACHYALAARSVRADLDRIAA